MNYVDPDPKIYIDCSDDYYLTKSGRLYIRTSLGAGLTRDVRIYPTPLVPDGIHEYPYWTIAMHGDMIKWSCHILMAVMFLPKPTPDSGKYIVNHIDGNKYNYELSNLEWITQSQNILHAMRNNLVPNATDVDTVCNICRKIDQGLTNMDIAKQHGVHNSTVCAIRNGRRWRQVSGNFAFGRAWADEAHKEVLCS